MRVGLVLSGAAAKGAYEIGALKAIQEYFPPEEIRYISASSSGTITGYAYSCGKLDEVFDIWRNINKDHEKLFIRTVISSDFFKNSLAAVAADEAKAERFYVTLLNLDDKSCRYVNLQGLSEEERAVRLQAAMAIMALMKPVEIDGERYLDGAIIDNSPVSPLLAHDPDYVICIHFDKHEYAFESEEFDRKLIKIVFNENTTFLKDSVWVTRDGTERMFDDGYRKTKAILDDVFSEGTENLGVIYEKIRKMNARRPEKEMRLTADIVLNNLTRITRKFTKPEVNE